jgi:hypothetical protein
MEAQLEARAEGGPVPELELVQVQVELALAQVAVRELALAQVAVPELELGQVAAELEHGQVAAELELVRVAAVPGLELDPVVALELVISPAVVPELETVPVVALELELVQLAVALRTKSVTAAHRPGQVPVLTAEDLAVAVAETTRKPAAAEAVIAWEVAE